MKAIVGDLIAEQSIADAFVDRLSEKEWNETIHSDLRVYDIEGIWKIRDVVSHIAIFDEAAAQLAMGKAEQIRDVTGGRIAALAFAARCTIASRKSAYPGRPACPCPPAPSRRRG